MSPALGAPSLSQWTIREVPALCFVTWRQWWVLEPLGVATSVTSATSDPRVHSSVLVVDPSWLLKSGGGEESLYLC